jgi:hypothetical protein
MRHDDAISPLTETLKAPALWIVIPCVLTLCCRKNSLSAKSRSDVSCSDRDGHRTSPGRHLVAQPFHRYEGFILC